MHLKYENKIKLEDIEVLMPDLTIRLPTNLNNNVKQCAFINPNHLQTSFRSILYSAAATSLS
jgi:hypothetical protein